MRLHADVHKCEGLGMCEAMAPEYFEVGAGGHVDLLDENPEAADQAYVKAAVAACPVSALRVEG
jgi:ferredoxin